MTNDEWGKGPLLLAFDIRHSSFRRTAMHPPGGPPAKISLPGVRHIVAVASGKGGVGKSTVATNLALALQMQGQAVGLLDADIYGPSIPTMMGLPSAIDQETWPRNEEGVMLPLDRYGLKLLSMGFFIPSEKAVIWRGPMIDRYLTQFLGGFDWGELDYLVVD